MSTQMSRYQKKTLNSLKEMSALFATLDKRINTTNIEELESLIRSLNDQISEKENRFKSKSGNASSKGKQIAEVLEKTLLTHFKTKLKKHTETFSKYKTLTEQLASYFDAHTDLVNLQGQINFQLTDYANKDLTIQDRIALLKITIKLVDEKLKPDAFLGKLDSIQNISDAKAPLVALAKEVDYQHALKELNNKAQFTPTRQNYQFKKYLERIIDEVGALKKSKKVDVSELTAVLTTTYDLIDLSPKMTDKQFTQAVKEYQAYAKTLPGKNASPLFKKLGGLMTLFGSFLLSTGVALFATGVSPMTPVGAAVSAGLIGTGAATTLAGVGLFALATREKGLSPAMKHFSHAVRKGPQLETKSAPVEDDANPSPAKN